MATQSVIIQKRVAPTRAAAERIAEEITGKKLRTSRETRNTWRFAQFPPGECTRGTGGTKVLRPGVMVFSCTRRGED